MNNLMSCRLYLLGYLNTTRNLQRARKLLKSADAIVNGRPRANSEIIRLREWNVGAGGVSVLSFDLTFETQQRTYAILGDVAEPVGAWPV